MNSDTVCFNTTSPDKIYCSNHYLCTICFGYFFREFLVTIAPLHRSLPRFANVIRVMLFVFQESGQKRARPMSAASEDLKKSEEEPTPPGRVTTRSTSRASLKDGTAPSVDLRKLDVSPCCVEDSREVGSQVISPIPAEQVCSDSPSSEERKSVGGAPEDRVEMRKLYREAIKRMLKEKVRILLVGVWGWNNSRSICISARVYAGDHCCETGGLGHWTS